MLKVMRREEVKVKGICGADKMLLDSAVRRQELAMKDLFLFAERYPELIPSEALGGLYAINILLQDSRESLICRERSGR